MAPTVEITVFIIDGFDRRMNHIHHVQVLTEEALRATFDDLSECCAYVRIARTTEKIEEGS